MLVAQHPRLRIRGWLRRGRSAGVFGGRVSAELPVRGCAFPSVEGRVAHSPPRKLPQLRRRNPDKNCGRTFLSLLLSGQSRTGGGGAEQSTAVTDLRKVLPRTVCIFWEIAVSEGVVIPPMTTAGAGGGDYMVLSQKSSCIQKSPGQN